LLKNQPPEQVSFSSGDDTGGAGPTKKARRSQIRPPTSNA